MRNVFQLVSLGLLAVSVCCSGCKLFQSDFNGKNGFDRSPAFAGDDRAKPWVPDVSPTAMGAEKDYLLDGETNDKVKEKFKSAIGKGPDQQVALAGMEKANELFDEATAEREQQPDSATFAKKFVSAGDLYLQAAERWPKSSLEQNALFRAGESYFFADHYEKANECYEKLVAKYRGTRYLDVVQARRFTIAKYWLDLNRQSPDNFFTYRLSSGLKPKRDMGGHALRIFDRIRLDDPTGKLADDATLALANGYFEKKRYMDASDTYEDLRRTFPNSEHQFEAHMFELRSRLESYQGRDYDRANLDKAEKLLKTIVTQFPQQADEHRDYLSKEAARVRMLMAEREMSMANYYDKRGEYRAAKMHYAELAKTYGDTPMGKAAQERIGEIADEPAEPPQRMAWLVDLFPESEKTKPLLAPSVKDHVMR